MRMSIGFAIEIDGDPGEEEQVAARRAQVREMMLEFVEMSSEIDESHFADLVKVMEQMISITRRARASQPKK